MPNILIRHTREVHQNRSFSIVFFLFDMLGWLLYISRILPTGYALLWMAFNFMLFVWEDNLSVLMVLVRITYFETGSTLYLYGVGSGFCGMICV